MSLPTKWPHKVKSGNASISIYQIENKGYHEFKVVYYDAERKRRFKTCAEFTDAKKFAENVTATINNGEISALTLTNTERLLYLRALDSLQGTGIPLDSVVAEFVAAKARLGANSLKEAVEYFLKAHKDVASKTVREVVDELIADREKPNSPNRKPASAKYVSDLRGRLSKFAEAFQCDISTVRPPEIRAFLDSLKKSGRTWFNYARLIQTLFKFAQERGYYSKSNEPLEGIDVEYDDDSEIEIFTPQELAKLFAAARPQLIPFLAIGAFAGLRHTEICRLDWSEIHEDDIEVKKGKAKTRSRRLVPIQPNLAKWLEPHRKAFGPVTPFASMSKQLLWMAEDAKIAWKHNALRHSFISYRMAITNDENRVASESGNSPAMIHANYRQLVTEKQAMAWFSIAPVQSEKVVQMSADS